MSPKSLEEAKVAEETKARRAADEKKFMADMAAVPEFKKGFPVEKEAANAAETLELQSEAIEKSEIVEELEDRVPGGRAVSAASLGLYL